MGLNFKVQIGNFKDGGVWGPQAAEAWLLPVFGVSLKATGSQNNEWQPW